MLFKHIWMVGLGGMIGSILRYLTGVAIRHGAFPYATLMVNLLGSLVIGSVMGYAAKTEGFGDWRLFLATGICGGFTTFSAFAWENWQFLQQQRYQAFVLYTGGSIVLGLLCVAIGYWLTK
ncbi:fluoride efflux transporter CrcB [Sediminibacterium soli]|uniref:fluoride efflux transporter CrcB n=1 Tax=Sediminibacterium soli TaxID=2698829 RepID=UPI001379D8FA|nr:fluoride efflux transporter CrcB [Sediminibacterium soli]NCI46041.1 fluoride efflux transporter CrcB [Sediminibacterium soli]